MKGMTHVHADLVDSLVERKKVDQIRSEGIFTGESNFNTLALDELDDLDCGVLDISPVKRQNSGLVGG